MIKTKPQTALKAESLGTAWHSAFNVVKSENHSDSYELQDKKGISQVFLRFANEILVEIYVLSNAEFLPPK